jgi:cold shock CspA family protein
MMRGAILKWWNERGFEFIERDDRQEDVFLHISSITNVLKGQDPSVGDQVEFDVVMRDNRPRAVGARLLRDDG